ncbi:histidine phosphatase family protein [Massilia sp. W12]|uniref:SixA phosphatase family protein n=1 Tax=Massilia sp. W12 TaxID=3126507 RepID=UPI0030D453F7
MELILWRHAHAIDGGPDLADLERPLSPKGVKQAARMAQWLDARLPENCKILVSPAKRTLQTVAPLMRKYKVLPELGPEANPLHLLEAANWPNSRECVLIVGHQPTLGRLIATLVQGQDQEFELRKGYICWISQREREGKLQTWIKALLGAEMCAK